MSAYVGMLFILFILYMYFLLNYLIIYMTKVQAMRIIISNGPHHRCAGTEFIIFLSAH